MRTVPMITELQAGEYARKLFAEHNPLIWDIHPSPEGDECLDVEIYCSGVSGARESFILTCWLEPCCDNQPYGEW